MLAWPSPATDPLCADHLFREAQSTARSRTVRRTGTRHHAAPQRNPCRRRIPRAQKRLLDRQFSAAVDDATDFAFPRVFVDFPAADAGAALQPSSRYATLAMAMTRAAGDGGRKTVSLLRVG